MYHDKFETFDPGQPLLPGVSTAIAQALASEQIRLQLLPAPTAEESGAALLDKTDLRDGRNMHLQAERIRFAGVPAGEDAMRQRIEWMFHAGSRSSDSEIACRSLEAIDVMIGQIAPDGETGPDKEAEPQYDDVSAQPNFDPESLAEALAALARSHPELVAALFQGDLDDVPTLIDDAVKAGAVAKELVGHSAWMFVCWAALEQQREACLGWRLLHKELDDAWRGETRWCWTIGQIFRPKTKQHAFAHEMKQLYTDNVARGVTELKDKRRINSIERALQKMGMGGLTRANERAIIAWFGERIARIPTLLHHCSALADDYHRSYRAFLAGPGGRSRAGQHADMLTARISAVHRTAIVCARTCHLALLAARAQTSDDLRAMLDTRLPAVLRPSIGKRQKCWDKFRLRQLFHVVRIELLQDGEHLPKALKGATPDEQSDLPLELDDKENRRGHELFDQCWAELNNQPADWRFITPFGWQCDGRPRIRLSAGD